MRTCTWVEIVVWSARGHLLKFLNIRVKPGVVRVVETVTPGSIQRVPVYSSYEMWTSEGGGREWEVDLNARQKLKWSLRMFCRTSEDPFPERVYLWKGHQRGFLWRNLKILSDKKHDGNVKDRKVKKKWRQKGEAKNMQGGVNAKDKTGNREDCFFMKCSSIFQ